MKLQRVAIVSKVGSEESEKTAMNVAKKFLAKKCKVVTISPIEVKGAKKIDSLEDLKDEKLDLKKLGLSVLVGAGAGGAAVLTGTEVGLVDSHIMAAITADAQNLIEIEFSFRKK